MKLTFCVAWGSTEDLQHHHLVTRAFSPYGGGALPQMNRFKVKMVRSLVVVTALCLCATSASAAASAAPLTMEECRTKYKAAIAKGSVGDTWVGFQEKQCGIKPPPPRR